MVIRCRRCAGPVRAPIVWLKKRRQKGHTTTETGLRIQAAIDENTYTSGIKVSDDELASRAVERNAFHGEWNYRLIPRNNDKELVWFKLFLLASLMNFTRSALRILVSGRPYAYSPRSLDPPYRDW